MSLSALVLMLAASRGIGAAPTPPSPASLAVASPFRIPATARRGTIRYRIAMEGGDWYFPETGEQHVEILDGETIVTVCRDCGREAPAGTDQLARLSAPNAWIESGDRALRMFARAAGAGTPRSRMQRLVDAVRARLDGPVDYSAYLSAREAFDARRGDCTEYALLLAAAARAEGLPARVAVGLAYGSRFVGRPHSFGPHAWVQVHDGERWVSHDAGLPEFGAGHIVLALGDGAPESVAGAMEAMGRLRIVDAAGIEASSPPRE